MDIKASLRLFFRKCNCNGGISMQQSEVALTGHLDSAQKTSAAGKKAAAHFFMSANTPSGFVSQFDKLYTAAGGWRAYILKGAPGAASALLPAAGARFENVGITIEYIHCVSDPCNIAALALPQQKICIIDGMPPHCIKSEFPGIVEEEVVLFMPDSEQLLSERARILQFAARAASLYDRVYRFIAAAVNLKNDTYRIAAECLDTEAIEKYAAGLAKRLFNQRGSTAACAGESERYLSGLTAEGVTFFYDAVASAYGRVFVLEDDYGVGRVLIAFLREKALAAGQSVISCSCPATGGPEHLLVPSLSIAFITANSLHRAEGRTCRHINIKRFLDCDSMRLKKARIGFNRRTARELYNQAVSLLVEAKADDDIVRECYRPAIDLEAGQKKLDALVTDILADIRE